MTERPADAQLLLSLDTELDSLRESLRLAEIVANFPEAGQSVNPVINFALDRVGNAIVESLMLRMSEALSPYLERAFVATLGEQLFVGKGRNRRPANDTLALLVRLRAELVAHRIKLGGLQGGAWDAMNAQFGNVWRFLDAVLDEVGALLARLEEAGLFDDDKLGVTLADVHAPFTEDDVRRLVSAANALVACDAKLSKRDDG